MIVMEALAGALFLLGLFHEFSTDGELREELFYPESSLSELSY